MSRIDCEICGRRLSLWWSFPHLCCGERVYCSFTCQTIGLRYTYLFVFFLIGSVEFILLLLLFWIQPSLLFTPQALELYVFLFLLPLCPLFMATWGFYKSKSRDSTNSRDIPDEFEQKTD
ncbi:MAG: hypothetical protein ACFFCZ_18145 [Promethearchaeota archaeon]